MPIRYVVKQFVYIDVFINITGIIGIQLKIPPPMMDQNVCTLAIFLGHEVLHVCKFLYGNI